MTMIIRFQLLIQGTFKKILLQKIIKINSSQEIQFQDMIRIIKRRLKLIFMKTDLIVILTIQRNLSLMSLMSSNIKVSSIINKEENQILRVRGCD